MCARRRLIGTLATATLATGMLVAVPGVAAAQSFDPSTVRDVPGSYIAAVSFALVLLFGGVLLFRFERFVEDSIDASLDRPHISIVYGLIANCLVAFLGFLLLMQLSQAGIAGPTVTVVVGSVVGFGLLTLAGLGYLVVGAGLTELWGPRQPWNGLVFGSALSAVGWLVFPLVAGALAWLAIASVGVGGPMRKWMHSERSVRTERRS